MATAYAAIVSLMNVLTRYQNPTCPVSFNHFQILSMLIKVTSLVDLLEAYSGKMSQDLLRKVADAAFAAEDMIESYYVDQVIANSAGSSCTSYDLLCQDMETAIKGIDLIMQEAEEVQEQHGQTNELPEGSVHVGPVGYPSANAKMVGCDEELLCLKEQLTSNKSSRQILPIIGMGGIGKTTLARNVYEDQCVREYFHIQAWATISQDFSVDRVINSLLTDLKVLGTGGQQLYQHLCGRKYLIVLDDIWDDLVWNEIRRFFPDNNNGSRILLTTRISTVAHSVGSGNPHVANLLDDNKSWELLSETVFGKGVQPLEFIKCGKEISKSCKGLPLSIVMVGGLLKTQMKIEHWENVASDVKSFINTEDDGHCLKILSLSYNQLPIHLKPCFLHMAAYSEDEKVWVDDLVSLWVAGGFLKPQNNKTWEEVAFECLDHLIDRNLVMVAYQEPTGGVITCSLHDLMREFCLREAQRERFVYQVNEDGIKSPERLEYVCRRLICHLPKTQIIPFVSPSVVHSLTCIRDLKIHRRLTCDEEMEFFDILGFTCCRLLRVLRTDMVDLKVDINYLVNLRYLRCQFEENNDVRRFFSALSLFWNLETLNISSGGKPIILPSEFWELSNLRHVSVDGFHISLPEPTNAQSDCVINNLQSLDVHNFYVSDEVVKKIPELKILKITYDRDFSKENSEKLSCSFSNLARLHKLQKLKCLFLGNQGYCNCRFIEPKILTFSPNLRDLDLSGSQIPWECMKILCSLPKLENLQLYNNAFCGDEWNSTECEFLFLKYLSINCCDLRIWRAESSNFPMLVRLQLFGLDLEEIPSGIGDVASLQSIRLDYMKLSAVISAKDIVNERYDQGDDDFVIEGLYMGLPDEKRELGDMETNNFRVRYSEAWLMLEPTVSRVQSQRMRLTAQNIVNFVRWLG